MTIGEKLSGLRRLDKALQDESPSQRTRVMFNELMAEVERDIAPMGLVVMKATSGMFCLVAMQKRLKETLLRWD